MKRILFASLILASCSTQQSEKDRLIDAEMEKNQQEIDSLRIVMAENDRKADSIALGREKLTKY